MEMIQYQNMVDIFCAVKTLRNAKPNMVETLVGTKYKSSVPVKFYYNRSIQRQNKEIICCKKWEE